jgi:hypothetical protein
MTEEEKLKYFNEHFRFTCMGPNLWRAYNRATNESASPVYNSKEAAIYYVLQELKQEMEENIETILGGSNDALSLHDDSTLCSGLPDAIARNGSEEKL